MSPAVRLYRNLGWPVDLRGDQVVLSLAGRATALIVPVDLAEVITSILAARDRPVPTLVHPGAPGGVVLIAGEPSSGSLPWPGPVQVAEGALALPPSRTRHGPVRWYGPVPTHRLAHCREIDVFAAIRTALAASTPARPRRP